MTVLELCFNNEMDLARRLRHTDHDYWAGYSIGLLNGYFESLLIPPAVHSWLFAESHLNTKARGYRAGYRFIQSCIVESDQGDSEMLH